MSNPNNKRQKALDELSTFAEGEEIRLRFRDGTERRARFYGVEKVGDNYNMVCCLGPVPLDVKGHGEDPIRKLPRAGLDTLDYVEVLTPKQHYKKVYLNSFGTIAV